MKIKIEKGVIGLGSIAWLQVLSGHESYEVYGFIYLGTHAI